MKKLKLYFIFYKSKFLFPLVASIFALLLTKITAISVTTLLAATFLVWFYINFIEDTKKTSLYIYYNLGILELTLYSFLYFTNLIILIGFKYIYNAKY